MQERIIELVEGTTRYEQIACKDQDGNDFDFAGYDVRTWLSFGSGIYVPTTVIGNVLSYEVPASASVGVKTAYAETRIFKNGKVFEVIRLKFNVVASKKPDLTPIEM